MSRWDAKDVSTWITKCLKIPYGPLFEKAGVDGHVLVTLTTEDLYRLGVEDANHIKQLEDYIKIFRSLLAKKSSTKEESKPAVNATADIATAPRHADEERSPSRAASLKNDRSSPSRVERSPNRWAQRGQTHSGSIDREVTQPAPASIPVPMSLAARSCFGRGQEQHVASAATLSTTDSKLTVSPGTGEAKQFLPPPITFRAGIGSLRQSASCDSLSAHASTLSTTPRVLSQSDSQRNFERGKDLAQGSCESASTCAATQSSGGSQRNTPQRGVSGVVRGQPQAYSQRVSDSTFDLRFMRGATFTKSPTGRTEARPSTPGYYAGQSSTLSSSGGPMPRAARDTSRGLLLRGAASPGVGRYSPPPRRPTPSTKGSFEREIRWRSHEDTGPGPQNYRPRTTFLSTSK
eukprot:TRINITY_DN15271_c0_g1_i1.p1 TRINITY_DN15271_c0_g1~~TRINITY_DN15271_c0_g1_i1.p1  ORF type:complete len:405 (-),score=25.44 TRINITY_DN15271_c0_g1_i1:159-1373(-)